MDSYDFTTTFGVCFKGWKGSMDFKNANKSTNKPRRLLRFVE
jgi:hypothetical protein